MGLGLLIVALTLALTKKDDTKFVDNTIRAIDISVKEADDAIEELERTSRFIFEELEGKYQELLLLYSMLDEKKNDVLSAHNSKRAEVLRLYNNSIPIPEIAKSLHIGQGEVKLIIDLEHSEPDKTGGGHA